MKKESMNLKGYKFVVRFPPPIQELVIYPTNEGDPVYACEICCMPISYLQDGSLCGVLNTPDIVKNYIYYESFADTWLANKDNHWFCIGCGLIFSVAGCKFPTVDGLHSTIQTLRICEREFKKFHETD